jgi:hypothetical protein
MFLMKPYRIGQLQGFSISFLYFFCIWVTFIVSVPECAYVFNGKDALLADFIFYMFHKMCVDYFCFFEKS